MIFRMKKNKIYFSKVTLLVFFFLIFTLIFSGNNGNAATLFQAQFEDDTVGNFPGDPDVGTRDARYNQFFSSNSFIVDNTPITGSNGNYLVIFHGTTSSTSPSYRAIPIVGPYTSDAYEIRWRVASLQADDALFVGGSISDDYDYPEAYIDVYNVARSLNLARLFLYSSAISGSSGSSGFGSVNKEQIDNRTFDIVSAGLQLCFKISTQINPFLLMFG